MVTSFSRSPRGNSPLLSRVAGRSLRAIRLVISNIFLDLDGTLSSRAGSSTISAFRRILHDSMAPDLDDMKHSRTSLSGCRPAGAAVIMTGLHARLLNAGRRIP